MEKPASTRQLKVAREIQKDLAEIIRAKGMAAFGGAMVTVSEVRVSPDLSVAKVYVSIFPSDKQEAVMALLEENNKALRGELGHVVGKQLRIVPELISRLRPAGSARNDSMSNLPLRFALRYLFARKSHNVINIISGISVAGMAIGTAALVVILSVFNGFNQLVSDSLGDAQPDLVVKPAAGKAFVPDSTAFAWLYGQELVYNMSSVIEEQAFITFDGKQSLARVKGVDSVFEEESPLRDHITDGIFSLHRGTLPRAVVGSALAWSMDINPRFIAPLEIYYPDREGSISLSNPASSLRSTKVTVSGLFAINAELDAELVIVPIETMRELLDYDDEVSAVEIRVVKGTTDKALNGLAAELSDRLGPDFEVQDRYRQNEALYKMMRYEKLAIYMILIFIVIIIALTSARSAASAPRNR